MNYKKTWKKILSGDEKVEYEFSLGDRFIKFYLIVFGIIGFPLLFFKDIRWMGISFILFVFFYFGFYLKAANAYAFTNKRVLIHQGWLSTHMISVDYSKITDVHIRESFFAKIITHTGNIAIITAGTTRDQIILGNVNEPYEIKKRLDALKDK